MIMTERIKLRPFTISDKEFLYKLNNDKKVNKYRMRDTVSMEYCIKSIEDWNVKFGDGLLNVYLMEIIETKESIGLIGVFEIEGETDAEIGYRLLSEHWGKGYCTESSKALIKKYFDESGKTRIFAETHHENENSVRFLKNNGFREEHHNLKERGRIFIIDKIEFK